MGYHRLWVITGLIQYVLYELVDSKCYGLLQVMGYHSMGYLRFDCIRIMLCIRSQFFLINIWSSYAISQQNNDFHIIFWFCSSNRIPYNRKNQYPPKDSIPRKKYPLGYSKFCTENKYPSKISTPSVKRMLYYCSAHYNRYIISTVKCTFLYHYNVHYNRYTKCAVKRALLYYYSTISMWS